NAPNSALAANFNTIYARRSGKKVTSAEKQTPITPLAVEQFRSRGPSGRGRISLPQDDLSVGARYAGELIAEFIAKAGGSVEGDVSIGSVPEGLKPVYVHRQSRDLAELVKLMLIGSNNYIANQIFLQIGAHRLGGPVSLAKSLQIAGGLFIEHDLVKDIKLEEGSGISPSNQFTAHGLAMLLDQFAPHAELLRKSRAGSRYKTGTIAGVKTLAGYAVTSNHGLVRFVILLGGNTGKTRFNLLRAIERNL
ncbi:MAG: D-alanyl-D-alanine carboxypeptidase, partial [Pseudomonadota bacterium]